MEISVLHLIISRWISTFSPPLYHYYHAESTRLFIISKGYRYGSFSLARSSTRSFFFPFFFSFVSTGTPCFSFFIISKGGNLLIGAQHSIRDTPQSGRLQQPAALYHSHQSLEIACRCLHSITQSSILTIPKSPRWGT